MKFLRCYSSKYVIHNKYVCYMFYAKKEIKKLINLIKVNEIINGPINTPTHSVYQFLNVLLCAMIKK